MDQEEAMDQYIELDPQRPWAGKARLIESGVPVWALVEGGVRVANQDANVVAHDYDLSLPAVMAALTYYHRHQATIDARLEQNQVSTVA